MNFNGPSSPRPHMHSFEQISRYRSQVFLNRSTCHRCHTMCQLPIVVVFSFMFTSTWKTIEHADMVGQEVVACEYIYRPSVARRSFWTMLLNCRRFLPLDGSVAHLRGVSYSEPVVRFMLSKFSQPLWRRWRLGTFTMRW